jgi:hypothetical protein
VPFSGARRPAVKGGSASPLLLPSHILTEGIVDAGLVAGSGIGTLAKPVEQIGINLGA